MRAAEPQEALGSRLAPGLLRHFMGHQRDGTEAKLKGRRAGGAQPLAWQPHAVLPFPSFIFTWASNDLPSRFRRRRGPWESEGPSGSPQAPDPDTFIP